MPFIDWTCYMKAVNVYTSQSLPQKGTLVRRPCVVNSSSKSQKSPKKINDHLKSKRSGQQKSQDSDFDAIETKETGNRRLSSHQR